MIQPLNAILAISGTFGVVAGAGLLVVPERMLCERNRLRQWLFERDIVTLLNSFYKIERPLYRHHRLFGAMVTMGALVLLALLWRLPGHAFMAAWAYSLGARMAILFSGGVIVFALIIGVFLIVRPSAIKAFEAASNRWIELFPPGKPAEAGPLSRLVLRTPHLAGLLLLAAGIACLLALAAVN